MQTTTVERLLQKKGDQVWTVRPNTSVLDALKLMADKGIGALIVVEGDHPVGLMSERDYARKVILLERASHDTRVDEIMTTDLTSVTRDQTTTECMELMTDNRIRHLPVVEGGRLIGLISIGDVVAAVISEQQFLIEQMESYISS